MGVEEPSEVVVVESGSEQPVQVVKQPEVAFTETDKTKSTSQENIGARAQSAEQKADDGVRLSEMMNSIAQDAGKATPSRVLMDEISKAVFDGTPDNASSVEEVYSTAYKVYGKMVDAGRISQNDAVNITRNGKNSDLIPPAYKIVDLNDDGLITSDEVLRAIEDVVDGNSSFTIAQTYGLIDFYKEYMQEARVVDFGGTKAVYVAGKLNILDNYKDDGLSNNQRFLVKKFADVDFNGDGRLTADEVNRAIAEHKAGSKVYTETQVYELIDLFFEE